jgi:hypothetical protein
MGKNDNSLPTLFIFDAPQERHSIYLYSVSPQRGLSLNWKKANKRNKERTSYVRFGISLFLFFNSTNYHLISHQNLNGELLSYLISPGVNHQ